MPSNVDIEGLSNFAFLFTATEKGTNSGVKFMATVEDAKKWCSSEESKGILHGTKWAYFWTSVSNFIGCHWGAGTPMLNISGLIDNGAWDEKIAASGCKKIGLNEFKAVLTPYGVEVIS